jgi:hypothetical protein
VKAFDGSELLGSILFSSVLRYKVTYCKPTPFFSDSFKKMPPMLRGLDDCVNNGKEMTIVVLEATCRY